VDEVPIPVLQDAIRNLHGCESTFVRSVPVYKRLVSRTKDERGARAATFTTLWDGAVYVFDLIGHSTAQRAYAWSTDVPGSDRRRFTVVLHAGPVNSPQSAVRAAIVAEHRGQAGR
jgi:hypothetical protein